MGLYFCILGKKLPVPRKKVIGWILAAASLLIIAVGAMLIPKNTTAVEESPSNILGEASGSPSDDMTLFPLSKHSYSEGSQTISTDTFHTVAVKEDGTVLAVGYNNWGQCDVSEWTDIIAGVK